MLDLVFLSAAEMNHSPGSASSTIRWIVPFHINFRMPDQGTSPGRAAWGIGDASASAVSMTTHKTPDTPTGGGKSPRTGKERRGNAAGYYGPSAKPKAKRSLTGYHKRPNTTQREKASETKAAAEEPAVKWFDGTKRFGFLTETTGKTERPTGRVLLKKMPAGTPIERMGSVAIGNIPLVSPAPAGARVAKRGISAGTEGLLVAAIIHVLKSWGVPESMHREMAEKLERIAKEDVKAALRPKWDERGKYAELKDLSAPQFLKRVYADVITPDGSIEKQMVRDIDPKLMASVEVYLSNRKSRQKDLGDADGLRLIAGPTSPLKRPDLG